MSPASLKTILRCGAAFVLALWLWPGIAEAAALRIVWEPPPNYWPAGYHVYRSDTSGGPYQRITGTPVAEAEYADESAAPGHKYYYVVTTVGAGGLESGFSSELEAELARYDAAPEPGALIVRNATELRVFAGDMVMLSGHHRDPEAQSVTWAWTQLLGPAVSLSGANRAEAAFIAPMAPADTVLVFGLTVFDASGGHTSDFVRVTIQRR